MPSSGPAGTFRFRPMIDDWPSNVMSKRLPLKSGSTLTTHSGFFWRFARPPSPKTSGDHSVVVNAHESNASGWRTTFAPFATKRSFTSTIHASFEMTIASFPTGVSSTSWSRSGVNESASPAAVPGGGCSIGTRYDFDVEPRITPSVWLGEWSVPPLPSPTTTSPSGANT